ncbi:hypothetical protein BDK51DRAFT_35158 [Blyttiomyces helicus]|uniref:Uncharacterized protein n=1 Tax=Blyttiomyces helicus TaxID=388810 RepID=A0A4P9W153_9FUNG|nr:hypothetical protein BDK51DRAFT_35158 [Blyttiomyces helicus]|eukprot:RKO85362.1 hypothetical protein BDK51DRAFT_35158 [Blyttiomyces helicus]
MPPEMMKQNITGLKTLKGQDTDEARIQTAAHNTQSALAHCVLHSTALEHPLNRIFAMYHPDDNGSAYTLPPNVRTAEDLLGHLQPQLLEVFDRLGATNRLLLAASDLANHTVGEMTRLRRARVFYYLFGVKWREASERAKVFDTLIGVPIDDVAPTVEGGKTVTPGYPLFDVAAYGEAHGFTEPTGNEGSRNVSNNHSNRDGTGSKSKNNHNNGRNNNRGRGNNNSNNNSNRQNDNNDGPGGVGSGGRGGYQHHHNNNNNDRGRHHDLDGGNHYSPNHDGNQNRGVGGGSGGGRDNNSNRASDRFRGVNQAKPVGNNKSGNNQNNSSYVPNNNRNNHNNRSYDNDRNARRDSSRDTRDRGDNAGRDISGGLAGSSSSRDNRDNRDNNNRDDRRGGGGGVGARYDGNNRSSYSGGGSGGGDNRCNAKGDGDNRGWSNNRNFSRYDTNDAPPRGSGGSNAGSTTGGGNPNSSSYRLTYPPQPDRSNFTEPNTY